MLNKPRKFSLIKCERYYKDKVLVSFYNKHNFKVKKKYKSFVYNGYKYRLNLETGELEYFNRKICDYSRSCSIRRTKILLAMLLEENEFDYFCTFTFSKEKVKREYDKEVYKKFRNFCRELKRKFPNLAYVCVPERHKAKVNVDDYSFTFEDLKGVIHFHMLLKLNGYTESQLGFATTKKVCCSWATRKNGICDISYYNRTKGRHNLTITDGLPVYNITKFRLGYTTASKIASPEACKCYVAKYISKSIGISTDDFKKRFFYSRNLNVPEIVKTEIGEGFDSPVDLKSEFPGELRDYIDVEENNEDVKKYINTNYNVLQMWFPEEKYRDFVCAKANNLVITHQKTPFDNEED